MMGDGGMGGVILGKTTNEIIALNENSLWTGDTNLSGNYGSMGAYQLFGKLALSLPAHSNALNYHRELDLGDATARVDYQAQGINYHRESFCSAPDQVMVVRLTAEAAGAYTGTLQLQDAHSAASNSITAGLTVAGRLSNGEKYAGRVLGENDGGTLSSENGPVRLTNCVSLTRLIAMNNDYVTGYSV